MENYIMIMLLSAIGGVNSVIFDINDGKVKYTGIDNCTIINNGITIQLSKDEMFGKEFYGLVKWKCGMHTGELISKLKCQECGIFCYENEMIEGCSHILFPMCVGILFGIIGFGLVYLLLKKYIKMVIDSCIELIIYKRTKRNDEKVTKEALKIKKLMATDMDLSFNKVANSSDKYKDKLAASRAEKLKELNKVTVPEYITPISPETEREIVDISKDYNNVNFLRVRMPGPVDEYSNVMKPAIPPKPAKFVRINNINKPLPNINEAEVHNETKKVSNRSPRTSLATVVLAASLIGANQAIACDNTLYIKSNGLICKDLVCTDLPVYDLPLQSGSVVCFNDYDNNILKIKIIESWFLDRYYKQYFTSDYEIVSNSYARCKGGDICWHGACNFDSVHSNLKDIKSNKVKGYGCYTDGLGCPWYCHHQLACTWYNWYIIPVGEPLPIYTKVASGWEVDIQVEYKDVITRYKANVNNPRLNLDEVIKGLPIFFTGFFSEHPVTEMNMVVVNNHGYKIRASQLNFPEASILGDFQMDLENKTWGFNDKSVTCHVSSCNATCVAQPAIRRLKNHLDRENKHDIELIGDDDEIISTKTSVYATINLKMGKVQLKSLQVNRATCELEIVNTVSCSGCKIQPRATLRATNILQEGIIPFKSNCSFLTDFVSCSPEMYDIELKEKASNCYLTMDRLNLTLYINFEFVFKGEIDPSKNIYSKHTSMQTLSSLVTNDNFISSLTYSLVSLLGFSFISTASIRLINTYFYTKVATNNFNREANIKV